MKKKAKPTSPAPIRWLSVRSSKAMITDRFVNLKISKKRKDSSLVYVKGYVYLRHIVYWEKYDDRVTFNQCNDSELNQIDSIVLCKRDVDDDNNRVSSYLSIFFFVFYQQKRRDERRRCFCSTTDFHFASRPRMPTGISAVWFYTSIDNTPPSFRIRSILNYHGRRRFSPFFFCFFVFVFASLLLLIVIFSPSPSCSSSSAPSFFRQPLLLFLAR